MVISRLRSTTSGIPPVDRPKSALASATIAQPARRALEQRLLFEPACSAKSRRLAGHGFAHFADSRSQLSTADQHLFYSRHHCDERINYASPLRPWTGSTDLCTVTSQPRWDSLTQRALLFPRTPGPLLLVAVRHMLQGFALPSSRRHLASRFGICNGASQGCTYGFIQE